jgi:hypothetical protein
MAADYADISKDEGLAKLLLEAGLRWYGEDRDCPAWGEPSGDDFQSSALAIAALTGGLIGLLAGFFGGWVDIVLLRSATDQWRLSRRPDRATDLPRRNAGSHDLAERVHRNSRNTHRCRGIAR